MTTRETVAQALAGHKYDTVSQDSGMQCTCGSDSRFEQLGGDQPWETFTEHLADVALRAIATEGIAREEFAVERKWGLEVGGSVGMTHNYPYTADSVKSLADGHPIFVRTRISFPDQVTEWEPYR